MSNLERPRPPGAGFQKQREEAIRVLTRCYVDETIDTQEFENRVDRVYAATSLQEISSAHTDLVPLRAASPAKQQIGFVRRASQWVFAVMGGATRNGVWTPAARMDVVAFMGGIDLDFREANLGGVTELNVFAVMGGVEIVVPRSVRVECEGIGIMGGFDSFDPDSSDADPYAPILRIRGAALMGGVDVSCRLPGERPRDARRRLREERRRRFGH